MCMELLGRLATSELPLIEADPEVIDRLRVLEAAGHIRVLIPPAHFDCDDCLRRVAALHPCSGCFRMGWRPSHCLLNRLMPIATDPRPQRPQVRHIPSRSDWTATG